MFVIVCMAIAWLPRVASLSKEISTKEMARGWGRIFEWKPCSGNHPAKTEGHASGKPVMVLLHREGCSACYHLKSTFKTNNELQRLSKNFVFINCNSREEPSGKGYSPDGDYVPRILFFGSDGTPRADIFNRLGKAEFRHYYVDAPSVVEAMKEAALTLRGQDAEL